MHEEMKEQFGGSRLSKFLFFVSWIFLICLVLSFFWRDEVYDPQSKTIVFSRWPWEITVACAIAWLCTSYFSYRLAGGRRKPIILEGMMNKKIPSYMAWSILLTFWFIPFGIVAIVYSSQVTTLLKCGDYLKAEKASKKAKIWCWIAFAAGLIAIFLLCK